MKFYTVYYTLFLQLINSMVHSDAWSVNIMEEHELRAFQNKFKGDMDLRDRKKETQLKNNG